MGSVGGGDGWLEVFNGGGQPGHVRLDMGTNDGRISVGDATGFGKPIADWQD